MDLDEESEDVDEDEDEVMDDYESVILPRVRPSLKRPGEILPVIHQTILIKAGPTIARPQRLTACEASNKSVASSGRITRTENVMHAWVYERGVKTVGGGKMFLNTIQAMMVAADMVNPYLITTAMLCPHPALVANTSLRLLSISA